MSKLEVLKSVDLGQPVAERDDRLYHHFVSTNTLDQFVAGRLDILLGQKGSGKSAILRIVRDAQGEMPRLEGIRIVEASNQEHLGNPVFRSVFEEFQGRNIDLSKHQPQLIDAWKVYILSLLWNEIGPTLQPRMDKQLLSLWKRLSLVQGDLLSQMRFAFARVLYFKSLEASVAADGTFTGRVEFPDSPPEEKTFIPFTDLFLAINRALIAERDVVWVLFDRLDEAFPGDENLEVAGISSILSAYKDLMALSNLKMKISLREDLLAKATARGFRAATHIRPGMSEPIRWDDRALLVLMVRRFLENKTLCEYLSIDASQIKDYDACAKVLYAICPKQVDPGKRKPATWTWVLNRLTDAHGLKTPRDVVSFFIHLQKAQITKWEREGLGDGHAPIFETAVFRQALVELSLEKLNDHLLAENPDLGPLVERFRRQKAEHTASTIGRLLGEGWEAKADQLAKSGFIERRDNNWKIPMLYRPALDIVQGAAGEDEAGPT